MTDPVSSEIVDVIGALIDRQHDTTEQLIAMGDDYRRRYNLLRDLVLNYADSLDSLRTAAALRHLVYRVGSMELMEEVE